MTNRIEIKPVSGPVDITITPPGSKSITNRALVCAAFAQGTSMLTGVLESDDTRVMLEGIRCLGIQVARNLEQASAEVKAAGVQIPNSTAQIDVEGSGTTMRFLTAALTAAGGSYRIDGIERMRQRPIGDLVEALTALGGKVTAISAGDCPPVQIESQGITGGTSTIRGNISSQFLSGLLMASPLAKNQVELTVEGELVSKPYVEMTIEVMKSFGALVDANEDFSSFIIAPQNYQPTEYQIEPDASAASYFWAAAAICGGSAKVNGLTANALQGDVGFVKCLEQMGCEVEYGDDSITVRGQAKQAIEVDMGDISDTVQTLAAVALFVPGTTKITNIAHNRVKETDRIGDLACELRKLGATVVEHHDGLEISAENLSGAEIETYNDHRMAMSLSLVGLKQPGVIILDPECVFQNISAVLRRHGFRIAKFYERILNNRSSLMPKTDLMNSNIKS